MQSRKIYPFSERVKMFLRNKWSKIDNILIFSTLTDHVPQKYNKVEWISGSIYHRQTIWIRIRTIVLIMISRRLHKDFADRKNAFLVAASFIILSFARCKSESKIF